MNPLLLFFAVLIGACLFERAVGLVLDWIAADIERRDDETWTELDDQERELWGREGARRC